MQKLPTVVCCIRSDPQTVKVSNVVQMLYHCSNLMFIIIHGESQWEGFHIGYFIILMCCNIHYIFGLIPDDDILTLNLHNNYLVFSLEIFVSPCQQIGFSHFLSAASQSAAGWRLLLALLLVLLLACWSCALVVLWWCCCIYLKLVGVVVATYSPLLVSLLSNAAAEIFYKIALQKLWDLHSLSYIC